MQKKRKVYYNREGGKERKEKVPLVGKKERGKGLTILLKAKRDYFAERGKKKKIEKKRRRVTTRIIKSKEE